MSSTEIRPWTQTAGLILTRVVVPIWVLAGAVFKLYERTPSNLPSGIVALAKQVAIPLEELMRTLIGLEFFAVGVMLFIPRFARSMAIFMLGCFCMILINELIRQATKCGCFGSLPIKPGHMLAVDGTLLISVLALRPGRSAIKEGKSSPSFAKPALTMIIMLGLAFAVSFGVPQKQEIRQVVESNDTPAATPDPTINPSPKPLPNYWYPADIGTWAGKPWRELEIFQFMPTWPKNIDQGTRYIVFYSRTCEHCQAMFEEDLVTDLGIKVTAVEIPASKTELTSPDAWTMPQTQCELLSLPLGTDWFFTPPLAIKVVDGKVECAAEGEHKQCLDLQ